jgi:hydrogenase expression/formation protein HypE
MVVPAAEAEQALALLGGEAAVIGEVTADHSGKLVLNTTMNTLRTLGVLTSDPLPRIC